MLMVDSDVLIWCLRAEEKVRERFGDAVQRHDGKICITPIQEAEIHAGIREKDRLDTILFLESLILISIDGPIGRMAGDFLRKYAKSHNVSLADSLIAAASKHTGIQLWTLNKRHYPMLDRHEFYD